MLPNAHLFQINAIADQFEDVVTYLITGHAPKEWTVVQKKQLVMRAVDYQLIARQHYKLGVDGIL